MGAFKTPAVGFHFLVAFELFPQMPGDFRFQEVSGLDIEMGMETVTEGGENRFSHELPVRSKYSDIILKRGVFFGSGILEWCRKAMEDFEFTPTNVLISLLNADHLPLNSWYVVHAIPKKWQVSGFNAMESSLVIETLTLSYQYFTVLTPSSILGGIGGGLGIPTGGAGTNISF